MWVLSPKSKQYYFLKCPHLLWGLKPQRDRLCGPGRLPPSPPPPMSSSGWGGRVRARALHWDLWDLGSGVTGTHSGALQPVLGCRHLCAGFLLLWRDPGGVPRSPGPWGSGGGHPLPADPFAEPHLPLPFASKMDSPPPLLWLPCHHPSCPPALPPARGLPSHGLARGGSGGVRQSLRLPAGEPPPGAPSGGKAASSPGPGRSLSGVGAGRRARPQELLASESLPAWPPWSPHTARIVCGSETQRSHPVSFSPWPRAARPGVCGKQWA